MEIKTWSILEIFDQPINGENVYLKEVSLPKPEGLDERLKTNWDLQLKAKQDELAEKAGTTTEIRPYHLDRSEKPFSALYQGEKPVQWPGPVVSLVEIERTVNHKVILGVGQMFYPQISALRDEGIVSVYKEQGIAIPRPALGINTPVLTADNLLTLTVRGIRTNQYPGRLYAPGGQPLTPDTDVIEHQLDEIEEEILIRPDEYNHNFIFGGVVIDDELLPRKPDLVGWVKVGLDSGDIQERVYGRKAEDRPNDVTAVVFASASEGDLHDYLTKLTHPLQYCPPAIGGLWVYGRVNYGPDWGNSVLKALHYIM
jgi:hypothetical protein